MICIGGHKWTYYPNSQKHVCIICGAVQSKGSSTPLGIAGPPAVTNDKLYEDVEEEKVKAEEMTCSTCKGRGYIITDIISGNTNPCPKCKKEERVVGALVADGEVVFYGDSSIEQGPISSVIEPGLGGYVRITKVTNDPDCYSYHCFNKGDIAEIIRVTQTRNIDATLIAKGITHTLNVKRDGDGKIQTIYYPNEAELLP